MITNKQITDKKEWEDFMQGHPEANFLQSWYWGEFHVSLGKKIIRTGFYEKNILIGIMLIIVEKARRATYATIPAGPIIDWQNDELVNNAFLTMADIAKTYNCAFVRVRPQLTETDDSRSLFFAHGFKKAKMHLHAELTSILPIQATNEIILTGMRKTTRHEIRKAESLGVTVSVSKNPEDVQAFYDLQLETAKRQKFVPFSYPYFYNQFKIFIKQDLALLYTASFEDKILAQAFIIFYNTEAVYHYGVSTLDGRKYPGAYLIQWHAIQEAKRRGLKTYNFWGVAPVEEKTHRFYPISIFKRGFGGIDTKYLGAMDLVLHKGQYMLNYSIESLRKIIRRV